MPKEADLVATNERNIRKGISNLHFQLEKSIWPRLSAISTWN